MSFSPTTETTQHNIRNLYLEIAFASVLAAVASFNSAFAIRMGQSQGMGEEQVATLNALLTSIPALVVAIFSIPTAHFLESRRNHRQWMFGSLLVLRFGYAFIPLLPLLFRQHTANWIVAWLIWLNLPSILFTNGFQATLGNIVPESRRAFVFSRRSIIWSIGIVIVSMLAGQWLKQHANEFPMNYQVLYIIGVIFAFGSSYFLAKLRLPDHQPLSRRPQRPLLSLDRLVILRRRPAAVEAASASQPPAKLTTSTLQAPMLSKPIKRMFVNMAIYNIGLTIAAPLFTVYYINQLKADDAWLGLNSAAASLGVVLGYLMWERILRKKSYAWVLKLSTALTWFFPVGIALIPNLNVIMLLNLLVNMAHPGVELSSFNTLLKLTKPEQRTMVLSWYNTILSIVAFSAPMIGAQLVGWTGIASVFILGGVFRIIGNILFRVNQVVVPEEAVTIEPSAVNPT